MDFYIICLKFSLSCAKYEFIYLKRMLFILFSLTIYKNIMKKFRKIHAKKKCIKINRIINMKRQLWSRMCLIYPIANFNQNNTMRKSLIVFPFSFPNRILVWNSTHRNHLSFYFFLVFRIRVNARNNLNGEQEQSIRQIIAISDSLILCYRFHLRD